MVEAEAAGAELELEPELMTDAVGDALAAVDGMGVAVEVA